MKKIRQWGKSAAGKISVGLLLMSVVLIGLACSPWGNFSEKTAANLNSILMGVGTNLIGIIFTVSFVQYFLDKQDLKEKQDAEKQAILRLDRIMRILMQHYTMYFNTITTPMEQRSGVSATELKRDFRFQDMSDLYLQSLYLRDKGYEPAIKPFYEAELELRNYCVHVLESTEFKYHQSLQDILIQFVETSLAYDVRGAIIGNLTMKIGKREYIEVIREYMRDPSKDWVKEIHTQKEGGNIMAPYVTLYDMLCIEKTLITRYMAEMSALL